MNANKLLFGTALAVAFTLSSCSDDNNTDTIYEQSFMNCYAIVTDLTSSEPATVSTPVTWKWTTNWTQMTATGTVSGLTIGGSTFPTLTISDVSWSFDQWCVASASNPQVSLSTGTPTNITAFRLAWLDRLDFGAAIGGYDPGLTFSFVIDGKYKVEGSRAPLVLAGTTVSTPAEGNAFSTSKAIYSFVPDFSKLLAEIRLANIQFSDMMPQMSLMTFPGIPFTFDNDGTLHFEAESLVPCIGDTPYPNFPITQLTATIRPGKGGEISFVCTFKDVPYTIHADIDYTSYNDIIKN